MPVAGKAWRALPPRIVILVALAGLAVTVALCVVLISSHKTDAEAVFRKIAEERMAAVQFRHDANLANQVGVNALFRASNEVSLAEFGRFVDQPRKTPWRFRAMEWAVRVSAAEGADFETRTGIPIRERGADDSTVRAGPRSQYFPTTHVWPLAGNESSLGFDLASEALRRDALWQAIDTGEPAVAAPLRLIQAGGDRQAYLIFIPSYSGEAMPATVEARRDRLTGVTVGVYVFGDNLEDALGRSRPSGQDILIYPPNDDPSALPVYVHAARVGGHLTLEQLRSLARAEAAAMPGAYAAGVRLAHLTLPFVFLPAQPIGGLSGIIWLVLAVVGAGTAGTSSLTLLVWRRERQIEMARRAATVHRGVLETSNDAFIQIDQAGRIVDWSPAAETMFGRAREQVLGQDLHALFTAPVHRAAYRSGLAHFLATGESSVINKVRQLTALRGDGSEFPIELMVSKGRIGDEWHFFGFVRDVTERTRTEARLAQAQKLEALGQLTGGIAHDFNNLLGIIVGNLDLTLELSRLDEPTRKSLDIALRAAMRGKEIIKSLLAVARRQAVVPQIEDANAILSELLPLLHNTVGDTIRLEVALCAGEAPTRIDRSGFEAAVINLIVNSRDAMPKGGTIALTTAWHEVAAGFLDREQSAIKPGRYLVVEVSDNGLGMPQEVAARAFDPFFTTKELGRTGGAGLGLAMVYGFAKQSGGGAAIDSEPERGTTVRLYLPAVAAEAVAA